MQLVKLVKLALLKIVLPAMLILQYVEHVQLATVGHHLIALNALKIVVLVQLLMNAIHLDAILDLPSIL